MGGDLWIKRALVETGKRWDPIIEAREVSSFFRRDDGRFWIVFKEYSDRMCNRRFGKVVRPFI
jgi:hypothetical protein